jgi:two-component system chemotaxis response regulator CheY
VPFRVLIVDDSRATRELLTSSIETIEDTSVTETSSGVEAIRILSQDAFDLILTDVHMPDLSGLELLRFVKRSERHRNVPIFLVSTEGSDEDRRRGMTLGASEFVVKPFEPDELCALARRYLGTR